jgi:orotate phosphoribosyltransferase
VGEKSAVQEVQERYRMPVVSVVNLADLVAFLHERPEWGDRLKAVAQYREQYGI